MKGALLDRQLFEKDQARREQLLSTRFRDGSTELPKLTHTSVSQSKSFKVDSLDQILKEYEEVQSRLKKSSMSRSPTGRLPSLGSSDAIEAKLYEELMKKREEEIKERKSIAEESFHSWKKKKEIEMKKSKKTQTQDESDENKREIAIKAFEEWNAKKEQVLRKQKQERRKEWLDYQQRLEDKKKLQENQFEKFKRQSIKRLEKNKKELERTILSRQVSRTAEILTKSQAKMRRQVGQRAHSTSRSILESKKLEIEKRPYTDLGLEAKLIPSPFLTENSVFDFHTVERSVSCPPSPRILPSSTLQDTQPNPQAILSPNEKNRPYSAQGKHFHHQKYNVSPELKWNQNDFTQDNSPKADSKGDSAESNIRKIHGIIHDQKIGSKSRTNKAQGNFHPKSSTARESSSRKQKREAEHCSESKVKSKRDEERDCLRNSVRSSNMPKSARFGQLSREAVNAYTTDLVQVAESNSWDRSTKHMLNSKAKLRQKSSKLHAPRKHNQNQKEKETSKPTCDKNSTVEPKTNDLRENESMLHKGLSPTVCNRQDRSEVKSTPRTSSIPHLSKEYTPPSLELTDTLETPLLVTPLVPGEAVINFTYSPSNGSPTMNSNISLQSPSTSLYLSDTEIDLDTKLGALEQKLNP